MTAVASVVSDPTPARPARPGPRPKQPRARILEVARRRIWPTVVVYATLATLATLTNAPGQYIFDNRFDQYWNPGRRLSRYFVIWDGTRGLGRAREEFWPGATVPVAALRWVGADPWLVEHLWHAALLTVAGTGMVAVLRLYRGSIGLEHLLAGLLYMFGPFSATFLIPSNLYYHYALAPWFLVVVMRGVHSTRPWRWAAAFALLVFSIGNLDTPGLLYSGVPVVFALVFALFVDRTVRLREALAWLIRAGVLTVPIASAALVKTWAGAGALAQRLESTETPEAIASASSWSESVRGLGLWLSYFRDANGLNRPQGVDFFTNPVVIAATFGVVLIAVAALWRARWRDRLLFGGLLAIGTLLMVGAYPPTAPSPYGNLLLHLQDAVPGLSAIRATYKAGAGYAMGVSALFGLGATTAAEWARRNRLMRRSKFLRALPATGAVFVLLFAAWPFWTGNLYDPIKRLEAVPDYWTDALTWLDAQPGDSRVLIAPGTTRSPYRWGWPGDDIFDALMDRPHAMDIAITLSNPLGTDVLAAIDDDLQDGQYVTGTFAPVARRLGIEYLVIRNDLRWRTTSSPRPADFETLRNDPDLEFVAGFGEPGQNVVRSNDRSAPGEVEQSLPPVEIYRVTDPWPIARTQGTSPSLLVSGSGEAWFPIAEEGLLDGINPIVYTASRDAAQLTEALEEGAGVVVTDTNRRQALAVQTYNSDLSWLLAETQELERPAEDLFVDAATKTAVPGSASVAWFPDAEWIGDTGLFRPLAGFAPQHRPSAAFDGNPDTAWVAPALPDPTTRSLVVQFKEPTELSAIEVDAVEGGVQTRPEVADAGKDIYRAVVRFSDGTRLQLPMPTGVGQLEFPAIETTSVEIEIDATTGPGSVGIAEVRFPDQDLDLVEYVQVPDDLARAAAEDTELAQALADAPLTYLFSRELGSAPEPAEAALRRRFRTVDDRRYQGRGTLALTSDVDPPLGSCVDVGLNLDGEPIEVRLTSIGPHPLRPAWREAPFETCEPVSLDADWHHLSSDGPHVADRVELSAGTMIVTSGDQPATLTTRHDSLTDTTYVVDEPDGGLFVSGDAFGERWRAELDGRPLGVPLPADAQNAWVLPAGTEQSELRVHHPGQRLLDRAVSVSILTAVGCVVLLLRRPGAT